MVNNFSRLLFAVSSLWIATHLVRISNLFGKPFTITSI